MRPYRQNNLFLNIISTNMSSNRSVQAAQRRRAGPPEPMQQRGPTTSINSAQMFANQAKPGSGPSMPTGRLAGQQAALAQQQMMQQQQQQQSGIESVTKMSIPQAITLITLRLGKVETQLQEQMVSSVFEGGFGSQSQIDESVFVSIMERLDALEKREPSTSTTTSSAAANAEMLLLKQQMEALKPVLTQLKTASTVVAKENKSLKQQIEELKAELEETKELVITLQTMTMDNSQKIMSFALTNSEELLSTEIVDDVEEDTLLETSNIELTIKDISLKEIVEQELNQ